MTRVEAEKELKRIFGFEQFYDEQWQTIDKLFKGERLLLIERTGFGKSLCYQFPATQFEGITVIFSPLIALMRDQVHSLNAKGIVARYINSEQSPEETTEPRMKFLCEYLGDDLHKEYANCDNTNLTKQTTIPNQRIADKLAAFRENYFPDLSVESKQTKLSNGVAASYYGTSNVGSTLHRCKYEQGGDFPDCLLKLTLKTFRKKIANDSFDFILYVPPTVSGNLVRNFAEKVSTALKIPISHSLIKLHTTEPQKIFRNSYLKRENVAGSFSYSQPEELQNKRILLIDDIFDSGATIKEIGKVLTDMGAAEIVPLVIARTVGGDL